MSSYQEIRADYDKNSIVVYQAYSKQIALNAIRENRFEAPFSFNRMTWIKPSFLWLMSRSNWGTKSNQEYTLGIRISRHYWEGALCQAILTYPDKNIYANGLEWEKDFRQAKVYVQWDPERTIRNAKLDNRTIQVGISRHLIREYNEEWIQEIIDYTPLVKKIHQLRKLGKYKEAKRLLPKEKIYPLSEGIRNRVGIR